MAALIREHDWATTPLGPTEQWPGALRVALGMALASPRAIAVYWGHDFICLYNDAYRQLMGDKHPGALGRPAREVFPEAREVIGPMFRRVLETGQAAAEEQRLLPLERGGASLEGWFTYTAEPILDAEGNVVGILNPAAEVTQLIQERRGREQAEARGDDLAREIETQRRAAAAHRESDEHFRRIADAAPALLWVTAPSGACTFLSQSWYDFTGTAPGTGLGYGWLSAVHPEDRDEAEEIFITANARREPLQMTHRLQDARGGYRWVIDSGRPRYGAHGEFLGYVGAVIDVDEREAAQAALRQSEGRYAALFTAMDEGFCVVEVLFDEDERPTDYRFIEINPAFAEQTGLRDAQGRTARELVPDLEDDWFETYGRVAITGEPSRFELESAALNRWFDVYAFRVGARGARRVGILFRDVTQRRRDEAALEASAARAVLRARLADVLRTPGPRRAIQTASALLLGDHLGADRTIWGEIDEARQTITVDVEHMANGVSSSATGVYDLQAFGPRVLEALRSGAVIQYADLATEQRFSDRLRPSYLGLGVRAFVTVPVVRHGHVVAVLAAHQFEPREWQPEEIALIEETAERTWTAIERSDAERALRASEERFRRLADSMPQVVWTADDTGTVQYYNSRSAAYDGIVGHSDGTWEWEPVVHPDDLAKTLAAWDRAVETQTAYECEHRIRMADGTYRWHLSRAERGETQGIAHWYGTATDIHELMEANELKDRFLAIASHELRNPVAIIHGTAQQIRRARALGTLSEERFDRYIDSLVEISTHLANLTNDLTDVSRLQRGALPLSIESMDIASLLTDVATREEWAPRVRLEGTSEAVVIEADPHRVRQVISNLIDNALKYSPAEAPVSVDLRRDGVGVTIEVTDYGIGLSADDQRAIFTPFGRAANAGNIPGLGMGLFVAREVAERHGGELRAQSAGRGQGTTMRFWLPATQPLET
ncbi:MAG: PAS domain S-box protein [Dehalococcoidia bacterium]|nr:PAS domain S-box protein [Dehalococcoidia bacterium]MCA9849147.1 PAS domain S-box protein [Dehalococcoidia bacterium]MCA9856186.1 PAS domain S-box protein [Dehalococcoidia bacterium]MCB9482989.1 PAS domain S-box protein [Dehalococcoidia bacterium]